MDGWIVRRCTSDYDKKLSQMVQMWHRCERLGGFMNEVERALMVYQLGSICVRLRWVGLG